MDQATVTPPPRRRRSAWRWVAVVVLVGVIAAAAVIAVSSSRTTEPTLSKSCQAARSRFVSWSNLTIQSLNAASDAMAHWDKLWNRWVAGQMTAQQQAAARAESNADTAKSIALDKKARAAFASFRAANSNCTTFPKSCVAEFRAHKAAVAHEARETAAIGNVYATATAQVDAWNAQQSGGSQADVDAATAAHNAAEKTLSEVLHSHDRVYARFRTAQSACNNA